MGGGRRRGGAAIAGLGAAIAVCLGAPAVAGASPAPTGTLPLWIDPQLLAGSPPAATTANVAPAATPPRFTVTRIAADGSRSTEAIDAGQLQALGRTGAAPTPSPIADAPPARKVAPAPAPPAKPPAARAGAKPPSLDTAALQAAARRLMVEPTWTALARRPLAAGAEPLAALRAPDAKKIDGKAALGVSDGRRYGETGRFYMYAAMKNKGVGMNVVDRGESWSGDGASYDEGGFAGQRSAGVGWRKGEVSASVGWVHAKTPVNGLYGAPAEKDDRVALTLSWRPKVPETAPPSAK